MIKAIIIYYNIFEIISKSKLRKHLQHKHIYYNIFEIISKSKRSPNKK